MAKPGLAPREEQTDEDGPRAWGKVILLGEHAVVYGHKAIAGAIHLNVRCTATSAPVSRLTAPSWKLDVQASEDHPVACAYAALLKATASEPKHVEVQGLLPAAAGLGSSAALCVAIARALKPGIAGAELHELANLGESFFHEQPSGIDVALSADGGIGIYTKAGGLESLQTPALPLVIGLSGVARSTAMMVSGVKERRASDQKVAQSLLAIAKLTEAGLIDLLAGEHISLGGKMTQNHQLLRKIGVSIPMLDQMVEAALEAGALGAKLTGAGGGGAMIALAPIGQEQVSEALQALGCETFVTSLGAR